MLVSEAIATIELLLQEIANAKKPETKQLLKIKAIASLYASSPPFAASIMGIGGEVILKDSSSTTSPPGPVCQGTRQRSSRGIASDGGTLSTPPL